ncbi:MAG: TrmB family transcriptional regulator [Candidatus Geothermarchaeales archaeon]
MSDLSVEPYDWARFELVSYGLTDRQSQVYIELMRLGPSTASSLAKSASVNRVETYRLLKELEREGFVDVLVGRPRKFRAADPGIALEAKLRGMKERVEELEARSERLTTWLSTIEGEAEEPGESVEMQVLQGREPFLRHYREHMERTENTFDVVLTKAFLRFAIQHGVDRDYFDMAQRGVAVRIVSEIDESNIEGARIFGKFCRISNCENTTMNYVVLDEKEVYFGVLIGPGVPLEEEIRIFTDSPRFLKFVVSAFEGCWREGEEMKQL